MTLPTPHPSFDPRQVARAVTDIVGERHVRDADAALSKIGAAPEPGDAPAWHVEPGSAAEVSELIRLAHRHRIAVVPVGNAARPPLIATLHDRPRFYIASRRMDHVLHLDETSLVVHVQAGLAARQLEKILVPRGLSLGDFPPAALGSTIGGLLSVRTPGKSSSRHGFVEDAVLGVSAVLADGRSIHTRVAPRRATGPDLARALCGSEGTLGFITSAVLRIHRRAESRFLATHVLPSFEAALDAVHLALREEAAPAALRVYDAAEAHAHLGGDVCGADEAILVVATAGPTDLAACDRDLLASAAQAQGGRPAPKEIAERWWSRRAGAQPGPADGAPPLPALQTAASPTKQKRAYRAVLAAATADGAGARAHASRFGPDGGVLFFTFTDAAGAVLADERLVEVRGHAAEAAERAGAYLLGASNPRMTPYLEALRDALDPHRIMNPQALTAPG